MCHEAFRLHAELIFHSINHCACGFHFARLVDRGQRQGFWRIGRPIDFVQRGQILAHRPRGLLRVAPIDLVFIRYSALPLGIGLVDAGIGGEPFATYSLSAMHRCSMLSNT